LHNYTSKSPTLKSIYLRQIYSVTKLIILQEWCCSVTNSYTWWGRGQ